MTEPGPTAMASLHVRETSPDGSVTAEISFASGLAIGFDAARLRGHDDSSLSQELTAVVKAAQDRFGAAFDAALDRFRAPDGAPTPQRAADTGDRDATREVVASGYSQRGRVRVRLAGDGRVKVALTAGTLAFLRGETDELAAEVTEAVRRAQTDFRDAVTEIRRVRM